MITIPGSWQTVVMLTLVLLIAVGLALVLRKRPDRRPHIRVGLDARHGWRPHADDRDSLALFRRIMVDQRTRLGI